MGSISYLDDTEDEIINNCFFEESEEYYYGDYTNNIHDKVFKDLLNDKEELLLFLEKYLGIKLEKDSIEKYNSNFITRTFLNKQSDIDYKKKDENLFFLIEHQSTIDKNMLIRLMEYSVELIRESIEYNMKEFPKVIPIVLYTGEKVWNVENIYSKVNLKTNIEKIDNLGIDIKYKLIDINKLKVNDLLKEISLISKTIIIEKCKSKKNVEKYIKLLLKNVKENQKEQMERIIIYVLRQITNEENIEEYLKIIYSKEEKKMNLLRANILKEEQRLIERGEKRGEENAIRKVAKAMKEKGLEISLISSVTGLKPEEI